MLLTNHAMIVRLCSRHPTLSASCRLDELALAQLHVRAANHQTLDQKGVAQPENGAEVVVLRYSVEDDRDRAAGPAEKFVGVALPAPQLRR
jgi:hypothetical protein